MQVFKSRIFDSCMVQNQLQNVVDACVKPFRLSRSALHLVLEGWNYITKNLLALQGALFSVNCCCVTRQRKLQIFPKNLEYWGKGEKRGLTLFIFKELGVSVDISVGLELRLLCPLCLMRCTLNFTKASSVRFCIFTKKRVAIRLWPLLVFSFRSDIFFS